MHHIWVKVNSNQKFEQSGIKTTFPAQEQLFFCHSQNLFFPLISFVEVMSVSQILKKPPSNQHHEAELLRYFLLASLKNFKVDIIPNHNDHGMLVSSHSRPCLLLLSWDIAYLLGRKVPLYLFKKNNAAFFEGITSIRYVPL
jgi:hypothetical protein